MILNDFDANRQTNLQKIFEEKLDKGPKDTDCWTWEGTVDYIGYGSFTMGKKEFQVSKTMRYPAHRVSMFLYKGFDLDSSLFVCHTCNNSSCVKPDHLFVGTAKDNTQNMIKKGLLSPTPKLKGQAHGRHKLTEADVLEIRAKLVAGESKASLAEKFKVSKLNISSIQDRETWKHL